REYVPDLGGYPRHLFQEAIPTWLARMVNEYSSADVFEALAPQLAKAGFASELSRECDSFAAEERRHGVLCGALVQALGGQAVAQVRPRATFPLHPDAPMRSAALRN